MKKLTFVLLFLSFQNCFSQNLDSLRRRIKATNREDTTHVLAMVELAYQFYSSYPDSCLRYANKADSLSKKINYPKGRGRALRVVGIYHYIQSDYTRSLEYNEAAINFSKLADDQNNVARCLGNMGMSINEQGNHTKALEYYLRALKIQERIGDKHGTVNTNNGIGLIYMENGNNAKALEYFVSSLKLAREIKYKRLIPTLYQNIGAIYLEGKKYQEALPYFHTALKVLDSAIDKRMLVLMYGNLADTYISLKETGKAWPYLDKAYKEAKKVKIAQMIGFIESIYAKYYYAINDLNAAYKYASESQAHAKKIGNIETWRNASEQKYLSARGLGKYKEALENYDLFVRLSDSLKNEQVNKKIVSMEYELKEEKAQREHERKELQFIAQQERQKLTTAILVGLVFVFAVTAVYFLYKTWSNKTKREMARIRERISRDIHDDMGSNLSTINILSGVAMETLSTSENVRTKEMLGKISVMSNLVMESVDEIVWSISPNHDSFQKIIARMRSIGSQLENQGIGFSFRVDGDPSKCNLDLEQRHDFYLIYKEAITNIAKYAKCRNVVATVTIEPSQVMMSIEDDGIGFEVDLQTEGNGLRNMGSRAKNLHGQLKIVSMANRGTALQLEFPV